MPSGLSEANLTDLVFYGHLGEVVERDGYVVVRTPSEPTSYLGNQIIVRDDVVPARVDHWLRVFSREFASSSDVRHITLNVEGSVDPACATQRTSPNLRHVENVVLTLEVPFPTCAERADVVVARVTDERIWQDIVDGQLAEQRLSITAARDYFVRHFQVQRELVRHRRGVWFSASVGSATASTLGLLRTENLVRFQAVRTVPRFRRRGIASHLISSALAIARGELNATRAVLVTNEDYPNALSMYKRLGFVRSGTQRFLRTW